eukprot:20307-Heterococcus_DN1.PRE.1
MSPFSQTTVGATQLSSNSSQLPAASDQSSKLPKTLLGSTDQLATAQPLQLINSYGVWTAADCSKMSTTARPGGGSCSAVQGPVSTAVATAPSSGVGCNDIAALGTVDLALLQGASAPQKGGTRAALILLDAKNSAADVHVQAESSDDDHQQQWAESDAASCTDGTHVKAEDFDDSEQQQQQQQQQYADCDSTYCICHLNGRYAADNAVTDAVPSVTAPAGTVTADAFEGSSSCDAKADGARTVSSGSSCSSISV